MVDTPIKSLRIDTPIKTRSLWRILFYASLALAMVWLVWLTNLSLLQYVFLLVVSLATASYLVLSRPVLLHLSQPLLSQRVDKGWQILMRTGLGDELWQADLMTVHRYPLLIHFKFRVIEPRQRIISMPIFRDQVSDDEWRELNILATTMIKST